MNDDMIYDAFKVLYASYWANERECRGWDFSAGARIDEECPAPDRARTLEIAKPYVERLDAAWGMDVASMFTLMEIPDYDWSNALYYTFMGIIGHGVSLRDDYRDNIEIAEGKLGREIDHAPFYVEIEEFYDLVYDAVQDQLKKLAEDEGEVPEAETRVTVEAWVGGDSLKGSATVLADRVTKMIVRMDDGDHEGSVFMVDDDECDEIEG